MKTRTGWFHLLSTTSVAAFACVAIMACGSTPDGSVDPQAVNGETPLESSDPAGSMPTSRVSVMRWRDPGLATNVTLGGASAAPAGATLSYYGGRVVSNIQVVQVLWGAGNYVPQVTSTGSPSVSSFFAGVTNSVHFDWLATEYSTPTGTHQTIGRGSFKGQYSISPSVTSAKISQTQIESELQAQISAGNLPGPVSDAAGNNNTYYAIFFPHGKVISDGSSSSCASGGFCAFHGTIKNSSTPEIYYGVHPDMQAGSGCDKGCGNGSTFANVTSVASHELVETVTDPEVGIGVNIGAPLAWYNTKYGEIGDICNAYQDKVLGGDGVTYVVQQEYSNAKKDCVVSTSASPPPPPPPPPPPGGGITNGGFESGLSGWTSSGPPAAASTPAHGGTHSALTGSTAKTNGDSSISQTFAAPAGTSTLSFWYSSTCPETVQWDWATATLMDNTAGTTRTVLAKTCASTAAWKSVSASVIAGHSYTLTLTNHDDDNAGDATWTRYDDVALN